MEYLVNIWKCGDLFRRRMVGLNINKQTI